ncbi:MAG TPA: signal peptidase I [Pilimelia sp.]|nr:signal peptidase I [Pilimelia sp.]
MRRSLPPLLIAGLMGLGALAAVVAGMLCTGQAAFVVTHGVSMNPLYHQGDLIVLTREPVYRVGEIVAYHDRGQDIVVLHRIIGGGPTGYEFKGDNNESIDPLRPHGDDLIGRAALHIPQGGRWFDMVTSPMGLALILLAITAGGGTAALTRRGRRRDRRRRSGPKAPADTIPTRSSTAPRTTVSINRMSPGLRATAGAVAVTGVLGAVLAALAWTGPVEHLKAAPPLPSASMTFGYSAQVPATAAYDGRTVTSPDPVFRRLTQTVDLSFAYQGRPGSVVVAAEASTASGWRTSIPLIAATTFTGDRYDGVVRLDLNAIDARAAAAASVIGLPVGSVTIVVTPRVTTAGGATFAPVLRLTLTPLQMTVVGAQKALVVRDAPVAQQPTLAPRSVQFLGRTVMTAGTARTVSTAVILAVLLIGAALMVAAHRSVALSEGAGIRQRYKALLMQVEPMTAPPGPPVVNVTEFHTLARLAERHGLMILHWSRSDSETFVVQDEGTTYRYRTEAVTASAAEELRV